MKNRICAKCNNEYPLANEYFAKNKLSEGGFLKTCKKCVIKYNKKYYAENFERIAEYKKLNHKEDSRVRAKKYYHANKEICSERSKQYRTKNKEKLAMLRKKYYLDNREKLLQKQKAYRKKNKDRIKETLKNYYHTEHGKNIILLIQHKRYAKKKGLPNTLEVSQWQEVLKYFNSACAYCGSDKKIEQDHFVPISKGGEYAKENIVPACESCNCSKNNRDFFVWYPRQKFYSKKRETKILKYLHYDLKTKTQQLSIHQMAGAF